MLMPEKHARVHHEYLAKYLEDGESQIAAEGREVQAMHRVSLCPTSPLCVCLIGLVLESVNVCLTSQTGDLIPIFVRVVDTYIGDTRFFAAYLRGLLLLFSSSPQPPHSSFSLKG